MSIASDIAALKGVQEERKKLRILILDIETRPSLALVWKLWKENIPLDRLLMSGSVMCVACQWYDEEEVLCYSELYHGHDEMIRQVWNKMFEADIVIHYNGDAFDLKHLNTEFVKLGLTPPSPARSIDLLTHIRRVFKFTSNKLDFVSKELGVGAKVKHIGFQLWLDCMFEEDPVKKQAAWDMMIEYCKGDVTVTKNLYTYIRPWIRNHPPVSATEYDGEIVCPRCASTDLVEGDPVYTNNFMYPTMVCTCGGWVKLSQGVRVANVRTI